MYHSITFGTKNTYDDWKLVPTSRPVFSAPEPITQYVEIPGGNGSIDLSDTLTGGIHYKNRTGSFEFLVLNEYNGYDAMHLYSEIMEYLHGQKMYAILEDDPGYYYVGRFDISWSPEKDWSKINIGYNVLPYKYEVYGTMEDWHWDPFNFENGVIQNFNHMNISGIQVITVVGFGRPVVPTIHLHSGTMAVTFNGVTKSLSIGENKFMEFKMGAGDNLFRFTGTGVISIDYRGARL